MMTAYDMMSVTPLRKSTLFNCRWIASKRAGWVFFGLWLNSSCTGCFRRSYLWGSRIGVYWLRSLRIANQFGLTSKGWSLSFLNFLFNDFVLPWWLMYDVVVALSVEDSTDLFWTKSLNFVSAFRTATHSNTLMCSSKSTESTHCPLDGFISIDWELSIFKVFRCVQSLSAHKLLAEVTYCTGVTLSCLVIFGQGGRSSSSLKGSPEMLLYFLLNTLGIMNFSGLVRSFAPGVWSTVSSTESPW